MKNQWISKRSLIEESRKKIMYHKSLLAEWIYSLAPNVLDSHVDYDVFLKSIYDGLVDGDFYSRFKSDYFHDWLDGCAFIAWRYRKTHPSVENMKTSPFLADLDTWPQGQIDGMNEMFDIWEKVGRKYN